MKKHILILGAGFSGITSALSAAFFLEKDRRADVSITVISTLPVASAMHGMEASGLRKMDALRESLRTASRIKFIMGVATQVEAPSHRVIYTSGAGINVWITYDKLILATGSRIVKPNLEGVEHAFDINPLDETSCLEKHLAALDHYPASDARNTIVICGGGFSGIESATRIIARLRTRWGENTKINIVVVDERPQKSSGLMHKDEAVGHIMSVDQRLTWFFNARVASLDTNGITLEDGRRIGSKTVVWTGGYRASELTRHIPAERDCLGRLHVDHHLQVIGNPNIFAIGDVAFSTATDDGRYPTFLYQVATSMGDLAGHNVVADILGVARRDLYHAEKTGLDSVSDLHR